MILLLSVIIFFAVSKIEVYVIPHTHIDQGWLNTIDGYRGTVNHILNQVTDQMQKGADRTFNWGEVYYFKAWFSSLEKAKKKYVRHLIDSKRFAFVHSGWVENDEACPTFTAILDQLTYGIEYLRKEFGLEPRFAWEIDPFGHDRRMIEALSDMGFEAIILNRVHFRIKDLMKNQKMYEFVWESGEKRIFCHTLFKHYSAPRTFDFEDSTSRITNGNIKRRSENLVNHFRTMKKSHLTDHILVPLGDDFKFQRANLQYENWDKLIKYINENHGKDFHVRYATAQEYMDNLKEQKGAKFPVITHDFFPYMDHDDAWWSGFYTTHPLMKHRIREAEGWKFHGEVAASLEMALFGSKDMDFKKRMDVLIHNREEVGVAQHHDYITGTSKRHVIDDYVKRMSGSTMKAREMVSDIVTNIFKKNNNNNARFYLGDDLFDLRIGGSNKKDILKEGEKRSFVSFNSILSKRLELIELVTNSPYVKVIAYLPFKNSRTTEIHDVQVIPRLFKHGGDLREGEKEYLIYFYIPVNGVSMTRFDVEVLPTSEVHPNNVQNMLYQAQSPTKASIPDYTSEDFGETFFHHYIQGEVEKKFAVENKHYRIELEVSDKGSYKFRIKDHKTSIVHETEDELFNYFQTSKSGAYLFRPGGWPQKYNDVPIKNVFLTHGEVISQMTITTRRYTVRFTLPRHIHTDFNDESFLSNGRFIKTEIHISEIPGNSEIVFRVPLKSIKTEIPSLYGYDGLYFRPRNFEQNFGAHPVAGKFFPSPQGGALVNKDSQVSILNSASQAMGAKHGENGIKEDEIMMLVHRRLMTDDFRGMSQANNDNTHLDTLFYLRYDTGDLGDSKKFSEIQKAGEGLARKAPLFIFENDLEIEEFFNPLKNNILSKEEEGESKFLAMSNLEILDEDVIGVRFHNMRYTKDQFIDTKNLFDGVKEVEDSGLSYNSPELVIKMKKLVNEKFGREETYTEMTIGDSGKKTGIDKGQSLEIAGLFVGLGTEDKYFDLKKIEKAKGKEFARKVVRSTEIRTWKLKGWKIDRKKCFDPKIIISTSTKSTEEIKKEEEEEIIKIKVSNKKEEDDEINKKIEEDKKEEIKFSPDTVKREIRNRPPAPTITKKKTKKKDEKEIILFEVKKGNSKFSGRLIFFYFVVLVIGLVFVAWVYDRAKKNRLKKNGILPIYNRKSNITVRVGGKRN